MYNEEANAINIKMTSNRDAGAETCTNDGTCVGRWSRLLNVRKKQERQAMASIGRSSSIWSVASVVPKPIANSAAEAKRPPRAPSARRCAFLHTQPACAPPGAQLQAPRSPLEPRPAMLGIDLGCCSSVPGAQPRSALLHAARGMAGPGAHPTGPPRPPLPAP